VRFYVTFEIQILVQYKEAVKRVKNNEILGILRQVDFKLKELSTLVDFFSHVEILFYIYLTVRLFNHR
jgi:hypothetical protein